ncbi:MAG: hypothetical protein ACI9FG_002005 [Crocinitomicaceae bacterium]|jgi:hypothetical protein
MLTLQPLSQLLLRLQLWKRNQTLLNTFSKRRTFQCVFFMLSESGNWNLATYWQLTTNSNHSRLKPALHH